MIMNYNEWFHKYHAYLTGTRNGSTSFNDTKWETINKRHQTLVDLSSRLMEEQPYGVIGNYDAFHKLTDLMEKSNYTFDDLNQSLIETYQMSLQNAMSKMLVNTHAVIASVQYGDSKSISRDKTGNYIIDVPYIQMHFGDRDEFIRQKLHLMYETENKQFISSEQFLSDEIALSIGFTLMCCVNGFMVDNWEVAIDDKGFRFKIPWKQTADPNFIIYKLDASRVLSGTIDTSMVTSNKRIPLSSFNVSDIKNWIGSRVIIEIIDTSYRKDVAVVPNFGVINQNGLDILNLQTKTRIDLMRQSSSKVLIRAYVIKYLHEIPNVYPAINYYDLMESGYAYDENHRHIVDEDDSYIHTQNMRVETNRDVCTPPISIDHRNTNSYQTLINGFRMIDELTVLNDQVKQLGSFCNAPASEFTEEYVSVRIVSIANLIATSLENLYVTYLRCAILTSLISQRKQKRFVSCISQFKNLANVSLTYTDVQSNVFDLLFGDNFMSFVKDVTSPFMQEPFTSLKDISNYTPNYFSDDAETRFNRPISEQCFLVLKYLPEESCWVFDAPQLKHFTGIENTFYINQELTGSEIYKFFFLYTDTENPSELQTESLTFDQKMDFDLFTSEVDKHIGYVKYWYVENYLTKLSSMLYGNTSSESIVNVLSKALKRKLDGDIFFDYPSEMNYEPSNASSDQIDQYSEYSDRAPFALNFMFYTISMLYQNEDRLLGYFIHMLTRKKFSDRYSDLDLDQLDGEKEYVNFSSFFYNIPMIISDDTRDASSLPTSSEITMYSGLIYPLDETQNVMSTGNTSIGWYPYIFTDYKQSDPKLISNNTIDPTYYLHYANLNRGQYSLRADAELASLISQYLTELYQKWGELCRNDASIWNQLNTIRSMKSIIEKYCKLIPDVSTRLGPRGLFQIHNQLNGQILGMFYRPASANPIYQRLGYMESDLQQIIYVTEPISNQTTTIFDVITKFLTIIRKVYENTGFVDWIWDTSGGSVMDHRQEGSWNVRAVYDVLKSFDEKMTCYQLFDICHTEFKFSKIANYVSDNPNVIYAKDMIQKYGNTIDTWWLNQGQTIDDVTEDMGSLLQLIDGSSSELVTLRQACLTTISQYVKPYYTMNPIHLDSDVTLTSEPAYATLVISKNDVHAYVSDMSSTYSDFALLFRPIYTQTSSTEFTVSGFVPNAQYTMFDGTDMSMTVSVYDYSGNLIQTLTNVPITFTKVGMSSDLASSMWKFMDAQTIPMDIQNVHETFDVNEDGNIINQTHADMHYELLIGNHFKPLQSTHEHTDPSIDNLQGPVDRIYLSFQDVNPMAMIDQGLRNQKKMFFKAGYIGDPTVVNRIIQSVSGKLKDHQMIYAVTDDGYSVFPLNVTMVDHAQEHGLIEAIVDEEHATWFETSDETVMEKYLTSYVDCTILDDNFRNFLDEFSTDHIPMDIIDMFLPSQHTIYLGSSAYNQGEESLIINMIQHDFNPYTDPELYPILRSEPDDHVVWHAEIETFNREISKASASISAMILEIRGLTQQIQSATTEAEKQRLRLQLQDVELKLEYQESYIRRLQYYLSDLETPSTWYNIRAYEDALVYINNGRAHLSRTFKPFVHDISYSDDVVIRLFDCDTNQWIQPSEYSVSTVIENGIRIGNDMPGMWDKQSVSSPFDYSDAIYSNNVLTRLEITFQDQTFTSNQILIFFTYTNSDVFDDITPNDPTIKVRFKPLISINKETNDVDQYYRYAKLRKHFDTNETYHVNQLEPLPDDFPYPNGMYLKRYDRSGTYTNGSSVRFENMLVTSNGNSYGYNDFDIYAKTQIQNVSTPFQHTNMEYNVDISLPIDGFVEGQTITLICVQNDSDRNFDGVSSDIMFQCRTTSNSLEVIRSTIPDIDQDTTYICTVIPDPSHAMSGGLISIHVIESYDEMDNLGGWMLLSDGIQYRLIPDELILVPKEETVIDPDDGLIQLQNHYVLNTDVISPYSYDYDTIRHIRYPFGNILKNDASDRLLIDKTLNPNVQTIRSNYIMISRYVSRTIPKDGIIDLTGYIPTPLTRDRYEIWVNGRYIYDQNDLIILSPTSFQLRNMVSLRNLEVIELVDDMMDSVITPYGPSYIDINGNVYGSYRLMKQQNANIGQESVQYQFGQNVHKGLDQYVPEPIRNPNNHNIEPDIMQYIQLDDSSPMSYSDLIHIPTMNGVPIQNVTSYDIGFRELSNVHVLTQLDKTWKRERLLGKLPLVTSWGYNQMSSQTQTIHVKQLESGQYEMYFTGVNDYPFTVYISTTMDGTIDDTANTVRVIPVIRNGVRITLPSSFHGKWIHSTIPNTAPVQM